MTGDRLITHNSSELWSLLSIIKNDFPKLKKMGYSFASVVEGHNCECFVYGWKQRSRAVNEAIMNDGLAFDLKTNKKLF